MTMLMDDNGYSARRTAVRYEKMNFNRSERSSIREPTSSRPSSIDSDTRLSIRGHRPSGSLRPFHQMSNNFLAQNFFQLTVL